MTQKIQDIPGAAFLLGFSTDEGTNVGLFWSYRLARCRYADPKRCFPSDFPQKMLRKFNPESVQTKHRIANLDGLYVTPNMSNKREMFKRKVPSSNHYFSGDTSVFWGEYFALKAFEGRCIFSKFRWKQAGYVYQRWISSWLQDASGSGPEFGSGY